MLTNAPKLLNILDTPDAVVRMALLNPNAFKEYASRFGSAKGWESVNTEGWPEAEKLVEDAKTDNLVSLLRKAFPKETDVQITDRLKKLTPEEKEKLYLDAPRLSSDGLTGTAVLYDLAQGGDEGHPYRKAAVNFLTNSLVGYGLAWGLAKGTFKAARQGKGLLKGIAPKVPANIEEQILKEAAEGEKMGMDAEACVAAALQSPLAIEFRRRLFSKIVPNVKSLGLLSERQRRRFADLGILEFESHTTSDVDQEIEEESRRRARAPSSAAVSRRTRPARFSEGVARGRCAQPFGGWLPHAGTSGRPPRPSEG